jgi:hypothetical protein
MTEGSTFLKSLFPSLQKMTNEPSPAARHSNPHVLTDKTPGSFAVRTSSGTLYALHLDSPREVVRLAEDEDPIPRYAHLPTANLRRDGKAIRLLQIVEMQIGRRGLMWLDVRRDGISTLRDTTEVVWISRLQDNPVSRRTS